MALLSSTLGGRCTQPDAAQLEAGSPGSCPLVTWPSRASPAFSKAGRRCLVCNSDRTGHSHLAASPPDQCTANQLGPAGQSRRSLLKDMGLLALALQISSQIAPDAAKAALVQFPTTHLRNRYILVGSCNHRFSTFLGSSWLPGRPYGSAFEAKYFL